MKRPPWCVALGLMLAGVQPAMAQTVNGNPPSGVSVSGTGQNVTVRWNPATGAVSFVVIRTNPDGSTSLRTPTPITVTYFSETIPTLGEHYKYQVGVRWLNGTNGLSSPVLYIVPGPVPSSISASALNGRVTLTFNAASETDETFIYRDGTWVGATQQCTRCTYAEDVKPGVSYTYLLEARFAVNTGFTMSRASPVSVAVPHFISFSPAAYLVARNSRTDFTITNSANPDGSRGGLVRGSGNGVTVTDPGLNKLAIITTPATPLGAQTIALLGTNMAPATVQAIVMRTPGLGAVSLTGVASVTFPGTASTLLVAQATPQRWSATFNALPPIDFTRDGNFGGATFCPTSDAVGVVLSAGAKRGSPSGTWSVVLQELNRSPVPPAHVIDARRISSDGKIGLVPLTYLTPDCTVAVVVDVSDDAARPYRLRVYDLLTRQVLGTQLFAAAMTSYDMVRVELLPGDLNAMSLAVTTSSNGLRISLPHRSF